jgi:uncharacterized membrane protein
MSSTLPVTDSRKSSMSREKPESKRVSAVSVQFDVVAAAAISTAYLVTTLATGDSIPVLRLILGLAVALMIPGYLAIALLMPRSDQMALHERFGLSVVASTIILIVQVLGLSEGKIRVNTNSLSVTLVTGILILCAATPWRRSYIPLAVRFAPTVPRSVLPYVAAVTVAFVGLVTWSVVSSDENQSSVQFWVSGPHGRLRWYPYHVRVGTNYLVRLHIDNPTHPAVRYDLQERQGASVLSRQVVVVEHDKTWSQLIKLPSNGPAHTMRVEFLLYSPGSTTSGHPDRRLWLSYAVVK